LLVSRANLLIGRAIAANVSLICNILDTSGK
jgi:hypothetical protein